MFSTDEADSVGDVVDSTDDMVELGDVGLRESGAGNKIVYVVTKRAYHTSVKLFNL